MSAPEATIGRVERMVALRSFPGWGDMDSRYLAVIAAATRARRYREGDVIVDEDHPVTSIYLIVNGLVAVTQRGVETGRFGDHSAVGGLGAFAGLTGGYGVVALKDTLVLEIPSADMEEIFEDRFPILLRVLRAMAAQCVELRQKLPHAGFGHEVAQGPVCPARELDLVERIFFLGKNLAMAGRIDSIAVMARAAKEIRLGPGEKLWEVGERGDMMVTLVCGRVLCTSPTGQEWEMGAGDLLGGLGSLARIPRWYTAEVVEGIVGLVLPRDVSIDVWEDHPDLALQILKIFATTLLDLQRRIIDTPPALSRTPDEGSEGSRVPTSGVEPLT